MFVFDVFSFSPLHHSVPIPCIRLHPTAVIYHDALAADVFILKLYFIDQTFHMLHVHLLASPPPQNPFHTLIHFLCSADLLTCIL